MSFLCGASRETITPPVGTLLYGYTPDVVSESVHDELTATAVAVGNGVQTALLISLTLGDIQTALCDEMRTAAAKAAGIDFSDVIIASTHTHCGPNTSGMEGWGEIDRAYVDGILMPAVRLSAEKAVKSMTPATVGSACGKSEVGINRRQQLENGCITFGQNPWGCYDPNMTVLSFRREDNRQGIVNLVHYGCHGTACGKAVEITRDWSGMMLDRMEKLTGTLSVFFNGAIGDVGPRLTNGETVGDITYVEELGSAAAMDAMKIYRQIKSFHSPQIRLHKGTVRLPYKKFPSLSQVQNRVSQIKEPEKLINIERLEYGYYKNVEKLLLAGVTEPDGEFTFPQTVVEIGNCVFVPLPFEHFSEISMRLREYSGFENTLTLSCANGYNGYLPVESELCRGGYEVGVFRFASAYSLADNTDQNIINENLRIMREN
ncbi:MAG: hypothetical protein MJ177_07485 [Clostridia bacterium]|nr:hypothetical protein [Clostridia bacterium]